MKRILLVDDDPAILLLLSKIVARRGWEPLAARSGPEALALLDRADAVVTDLSMPGMDGLELLRAVRDHDATLPVILVTGHYWEGLAERALAAGAFRCLAKPFDLQQLTRAVTEAIEARPRASAAAACAV